MLKFINPYYKPAAQKEKEDLAGMLAPRLDAWLQTQAGNKTITLAEIKDQFPDVAGKLDRVTINIACSLLGLVIENPEDQTA